MIPCEIMAKNVLPLIRKKLVLILKKENKNNAEISRELGITKSTVTHYLQKKRAVLKNREIENEVLHILDECYAQGNNDFSKMYCQICKELRKKKKLCSLDSVSYSEDSLACKNCVNCC